jgi:hypothetical protein
MRTFSRVLSSRIAKSCLILLLVASASSCAAKAVSGFAWRDASGRPIEFFQSESWPEGEEGDFGRQRSGNSYLPIKPFSLTPDEAIELMVSRKGSTRSDGTRPARIQISLSSKPGNGENFSSASFPLIEDKARLVICVESRSRIASLKIESTEPEMAFSVDGIATVRRFKGIRHDGEGLSVSSGFTLAIDGGDREFSMEKPFAPGDGDGSARGEGRQGILLEYSKTAEASPIRIEALLRDGSKRSFKLRLHPEGTRTALDTSVVPIETALLTLRAPENLNVSSFFAADLSEADYELADLGRVIGGDGKGRGDFALYRWDMLPSVLVFDFRDYATQDKYLKRLAFFVEKAGYRGVLASDERIAPLHGWNAHDYKAEDMAAFFEKARETGFALGSEEKALESLLLKRGTLRKEGERVVAGKGALISISNESSDYLRWTFAVHESTHALFFSDPEYRDFVRSLWASIDPEEKWFWKTYLGWAAYDTRSDYLMGNEFQAYLLQQPKEKAEEYFTKRKAEELLEKHEELRPRVDEYMARYGGSFERRAGQLEAWLNRKYGIESGRSIFLTERN